MIRRSFVSIALAAALAGCGGERVVYLNEDGSPWGERPPGAAKWKPAHYHANTGDSSPVRILHFEVEDLMFVGDWKDQSSCLIYKRRGPLAPWRQVWPAKARWLELMGWLER